MHQHIDHICLSILIVAAALLGLDRHLGMQFFAGSDGVMNYISLFWIWGHPHVYILILPACGIYSEVVATFSGRRLFGYKSLVYSMVAITGLSLVVWLHHFYTIGSRADVNAFFGRAAPLIAVPTAVTIVSVWLHDLSGPGKILGADAFYARVYRHVPRRRCHGLFVRGDTG